jgi:hypothetical protein
MQLHYTFPTGIITDSNVELAKKLLPHAKKALKNPAYISAEHLGYTSTYKVKDLAKLPEFAPFVDYITSATREFITLLGYNIEIDPRRFNVVANCMKENEYHEKHPHPMSLVSGAFYLQAPEGSAPIRVFDPRPFRNFLLFKSKEPKPTNVGSIELIPKEGELVLFESWLEHAVPKNKSKKDRIALVFNYSS